MSDILVLVILIILLILALGFLLMKKVKKSKGGYNHIIEFDKESVEILNAFLSKLHEIEKLPDKPTLEGMERIRSRLKALAPKDESGDKFIKNGMKFLTMEKTSGLLHQLCEKTDEKYRLNLLSALDESQAGTEKVDERNVLFNYWLDKKRAARPRITKIQQKIHLNNLKPSPRLKKYFSGVKGYQILNGRRNFIKVQLLAEFQKAIFSPIISRIGKRLCDESFQVEYAAHRNWDEWNFTSFSYDEGSSFEELDGEIFSWKHSVHLYRGVRSNNADMTVFLEGFYQVPFQELTVGKEYNDPGRGEVSGKGLYTTGNFETACQYASHIVYGYEMRYNNYCYINIAYILDEKYMAAITHDYAPEFIHKMSREAVDLWCCRAYEHPRPNQEEDDPYIYAPPQASILTYVEKRKDLVSFLTLEDKIEELWRRLEECFPGIRANAKFETDFYDYTKYCRRFDLNVCFTHSFEDDFAYDEKLIEDLESDITEIPNYEVIIPRGQGVLLREVLLLD